MKKNTFLLGLMLFCGHSLSAQKASDLPRITTINGSFSVELPQKQYSKQYLQANFNEMFNLSADFSFVKMNERTDDLGFEHINYQQKYKGVALDGFIVMTHFKDEKATVINGQIAELNELNITPTLSTEEALDKAKARLNVSKISEQYMPELLITPIDTENGSAYKLAYKVRIDASSPRLLMKNVWVDANTGAILKVINLIAHGDVNGTAFTLYSGAKSITADSYNGVYRLRESVRKIQTFDASNADFVDDGTTGFTNHTDIYDCNNV